MPDTDYVIVPQNDTAQLEQVEREYSSDPAKGIAHGVQKDAIQNSFGARSHVKELVACKDWEMHFELKKINKKNALIFWDKGTTGLTGDILNAEEITERFASGNLGPEQRLGRFLARFVSGDNLGAGSFGRGKLIFHAASEDTSILIDSLRSTDNEYISLDRKIINGSLNQPRIPKIGDDAKQFIIDQTGSALQPLVSPGTRIAILNIKPEVVEAFKDSFSDGSKYNSSFAYMIGETWWEIIHKFNAKIFLTYKDETVQIELKDKLLEIASANGGNSSIQVHEAKNISFVVSGQPYRIKEIKLILMPDEIPDLDLQDIWIQRKRMKIGSVVKNLFINAKIAKRLCGYVILENDLEDLVEKYESTTHYSFNFRASATKKIRDAVREELNKFERRLGLVSTSSDSQSRRRLLDSMKELNELASELGLVTQQNIGTSISDIEILFKEIVLPDANTLRIEMNDTVGPIKYKVCNRSSRDILGYFCVVAKQHGSENVELFKKRVDFHGECEEDITVEHFIVSEDLFQNAKPLVIEAYYTLHDSNKILSKCKRTLFVGIDQPEQEKAPLGLILTCQFPRKDTRRIENSEVIRRIRIKATNNTAHEIPLDLSCTARHLENSKTGRLTTPLFELFQIKDKTLKAQEDFEMYLDDLTISPENFGSVLETPADLAERSCDLFCVARLSKASIELNMPRKTTLNKVSMKFYLEVDPPGQSIFKTVEDVELPGEGWQSKHEGNMDNGYTFVRNVGHASYRFVESRDDNLVITRYNQEQMLRQAYLIAFNNEIYKGPAEQYKDALLDERIPPQETARIFDIIIGSALNQF